VPEFLQRALLEVVLLGIAGGLLGPGSCCGGWRSSRTRPDRRRFPGLVVAGPWGLPAQAAALGAGLLYAGGLERLVRRRGVAPDAATGCCS
jgi:ABC-type Mn2+/Zn2+ transport system permease subunit